MKTTSYHSETHANCTVRIVQDPNPSNPRKDCENFGRMACWHGRYTLGDEQPKHDASEHKLELLREAGEDAFVDGLDARFEAINISHPYGSDAYVKAFGAAFAPIYAERDALLAKHYVILPLYLYDHSGITMSTGPFSCAWDSGQVGFIYVSLANARANWLRPDAEWGTLIPWHNGTTKTMREAAMAVLTSEVKNYDQYLRDECYGYEVTHKHTGKEESCWGFYQDEQPDAKDSYILNEARNIAQGLDEEWQAEVAERQHWAERDVVTV